MRELYISNMGVELEFVIQVRWGLKRFFGGGDIELVLKGNKGCLGEG